MDDDDDDDGFLDTEELDFGTDPLDPASYPGAVEETPAPVGAPLALVLALAAAAMAAIRGGMGRVRR